MPEITCARCGCEGVAAWTAGANFCGKCATDDDRNRHTPALAARICEMESLRNSPTDALDWWGRWRELVALAALTPPQTPAGRGKADAERWNHLWRTPFREWPNAAAGYVNGYSYMDLAQINAETDAAIDAARAQTRQKGTT